MGKRANWVPVVTGLIRKDNQFLVGLRPQGKNLSGLWEFPGGKIEMGESPTEALSRELSEELSIDAEVGPLVLAGSHHYGDVGILILFYEIKFWKGAPKAQHHTELKWVNLEDLKNFELPEANKKLLPQIIESIL